MCLILFSWQQNPSHPLILIANRDELYQRATAALHHWETPTGVVAGRDLEAGGTWLAAHPSGRFAALTNVRSQPQLTTASPSRGELIPDFLSSKLNLEQWSKQLQQRGDQYSGFNLLFGDLSSSQLFCYNNQTSRLTALTAGLYGLSNAELDDGWPKVTRGKDLLKTALSQQPTPNLNTLWPILADELQPSVNQLPDTGIGLTAEQLLAPITIRSERYGTCSSMVMISHGTQTVAIHEQQRRPQMEDNIISITLTLRRD